MGNSLRGRYKVSRPMKRRATDVKGEDNIIFGTNFREQEDGIMRCGGIGWALVCSRGGSRSLRSLGSRYRSGLAASGSVVRFARLLTTATTLF